MPPKRGRDTQRLRHVCRSATQCRFTNEPLREPALEAAVQRTTRRIPAKITLLDPNRHLTLIVLVSTELTPPSPSETWNWSTRSFKEEFVAELLKVMLRSKA